jgi:hydrogenase maturation protein HypF
VRHHAAHVAAVAAEHRRRDSLIGVALDGYGYGDDGGAWGRELLLRDGVAWRRRGHLRPLPLPGGNRTAREPWRMGVAALVAIGRGGEAGNRFPAEARAGPLATLVAAHTGETTTSMGRLFDAASAPQAATSFGGNRMVDWLAGEQLPRIC